MCPWVVYFFRFWRCWLVREWSCIKNCEYDLAKKKSIIERLCLLTKMNRQQPLLTLQSCAPGSIYKIGVNIDLVAFEKWKDQIRVRVKQQREVVYRCMWSAPLPNSSPVHTISLVHHSLSHKLWAPPTGVSDSKPRHRASELCLYQVVL